MAESSFAVFCPECNMLVEAKVVAEGQSSLAPQNTPALVDDADKPYRCDHYSVCLCPRCEQPFFVKQSLYGVVGEFETVTDQTAHYPGEPKLLSESLPDSVKTACDQAARCLTASLFEPCVLMSRKCPEAVCKPSTPTVAACTHASRTSTKRNTLILDSWTGRTKSA